MCCMIMMLLGNLCGICLSRVDSVVGLLVDVLMVISGVRLFWRFGVSGCSGRCIGVVMLFGLSKLSWLIFLINVVVLCLLVVLMSVGVWVVLSVL